MLGAALTPVLWTVLGWLHIVLAWFSGRQIHGYEWIIVGLYSAGSLAYLGWKWFKLD